jgi:hypothetical protein
MDEELTAESPVDTVIKGFRKKMDGLGFGLAGPQCRGIYWQAHDRETDAKDFEKNGWSGIGKTWQEKSSADCYSPAPD